MKITEEKTVDLLDWAWAIIANASGGDWKKQHKEWQKAAERWRNTYVKATFPRKEKEHKTDGTKCWCNPKVVSYKKTPN